MRHPPADYLKGLLDNSNTSIAVHTNLRMTQHRQNTDYDTLDPVRERTFDVGDPVYIHTSGTTLRLSKILLPTWKGLTICEDRDISLWLRRKRRAIIDLDKSLTMAATIDHLCRRSWGDVRRGGNVHNTKEYHANYPRSRPINRPRMYDD